MTCHNHRSSVKVQRFRFGESSVMGDYWDTSRQAPLAAQLMHKQQRRKGLEMARNTIPGIQTGGGIMSKVVGTLVLIAVVVVVVKYPADAASWVRGLGTVIDGLVSFIRALLG